MQGTGLILTAIFLLLVNHSVFAEEPVLKNSNQAVETAERAFAASMAQRDFETFKTFISEDAVFLSESVTLRGKQQIADTWEAYFKEPLAPFSWEPENIEVLESGTLAWSSGPVYDAAGEVVATFNTVWQLDASHQRPGEYPR
jgi:hypothetical protein